MQNEQGEKCVRICRGPSIIFSIFMSVQSVLFLFAPPSYPKAYDEMLLLLLNLFHVFLYAYS